MKKRILGLVLTAGIILAFGASAFAAAATTTPTFSITALPNGTAGKTYSQAIKITVSSSDSLTLSADTTLFAKYNFKTDATSVTVNKQTEATITLSSEGLKEASKSGIKIKFRGTNTLGGQKYITNKEFTLKIAGTKASFSAPTEKDLGKAFLGSDSGVDTLKKGVAVVGTALPTDKINITAGGTQPITMTATSLNGMSFELKSGGTAVDKGASGNSVYKLYGTPTQAGTLSIKVTAENPEVGKATETYKLTVLDKPELTTTSLANATFGQKYSVKVAGKGGTSAYPVAYYATNLPKGFKITSKDGKIEGTISKDAVAFTQDDTEKEVSVTVGVVSYSDPKHGGSEMASATLKDSKTMKLKIKAVKPVILSKDVYGDTFTLSASKNLAFSLAAAANAKTKLVKAGSPIIKDNKIYVYASYPAAEFVTENLPAGVTATQNDTTDDEKKFGAVKKLEITVAESNLVPAKNHTMTITAKNAAGSDTVKLKFNIDGAAPTLTGTLPSGNKNVNDTQTDVTLTANESVKWTAKKLPGGLKLTPSSDGKSATLGGKYTKAQESTTYTITLKSVATGKTLEKSADIGVFALPEFTTRTLGTATTGKTYKVKVALKDKNHEISAAKVGETNIFNTKATVNTAGDFQYISKDKTLSVDLSKIPSGGKIGVTFTGKNAKNDTTTVTLSLDVKGTAPKFTTTTIDSSGFKKGTAITAQDIKVSGTQPMSYKASIAAADAKKLSLGDSAVTFTDKTEEGTTKFKLTSSDAGGGVMNIKLEGTPAVVTKGLPLTIEVTNAAAGGKWIKKVFKIDVAGGGIALKRGDKKASDDWTVNTLEGSAITAITLTTSADKPYKITSTPAVGKSQNGISVATAENGGNTNVTISGTPTKAGKIPVTVTLENPTTKAKHKVKVTFNVLAIPSITSKDKVIISKDYVVGQKISIKPKVNPNKDLTWSIVDSGTTDGYKNAEGLAKVGLTFNTTTGELSGTATATTSKDKKYSPVVVNVKATNSSGGESGTGSIKFGIKGARLSITTKTIRLCVTSTDDQIKAAYPKIATTPDAGGVTWSVVGDNDTPITLDNGVPKGNGSNKVATKGKTLTVQADNVGTVVTGKIKVIAYDSAPSISTTMDGKTLTAAKDAKVTDETTFTVTNTSITGDTGINWSLTKQPEGISAKIKANTDDKGKTATLTLTVPKAYKHGTDSSDTQANYSTTLKVRATNKQTQAYDEKEYTITVNTKGVWTATALPENKEALPEDEELTEDEETTDEETDEVKAAEGVTLGAARTEASLTAGQRAAIEKEGYIIAAVLPEMTVAESGQYDLEVELYEKTPEGAKLVWFAFPQGVEASTDDEIAEFFDEARADIETVPASRKIVVSPWLEAEVTYAPVIVVKAEDADGAKDSLEGAEAGDVVTEEALAAAE